MHDLIMKAAQPLDGFGFTVFYQLDPVVAYRMRRFDDLSTLTGGTRQRVLGVFANRQDAYAAIVHFRQSYRLSDAECKILVRKNTKEPRGVPLAAELPY